jgi:uncharacterized protein YutE (UPF0331/DUF86 family)
MVDSDRVYRILADVTRRLGRLDTHAALPRAELLTDETTLESVKYLFVTAIEGAIDVAQHLCASEGWGAPDTNADAFRLVGRAGVLAPDLVDELVAANGFRNVLVHGYAVVDDRRVVDALADRDGLRLFVTTISEWLQRQPGE